MPGLDLVVARLRDRASKYSSGDIRQALDETADAFEEAATPRRKDEFDVLDVHERDLEALREHEITHLYHVIERGQNDLRKERERVAELETVVADRAGLFAEIERHAQLARAEHEALATKRFDEERARLRGVVELAQKAVASRKEAIQHGRATQAECDLAKVLAGGGL